MVWDNGSTDGTRDWLIKNMVDKSELVFSDNVGLTGALNAFFRIYCPRADFVYNVDNDTVVPPGWSETLRNVANEFGVGAVQGTHQVLDRPEFFGSSVSEIGQYNDLPVYKSSCLGGSGVAFKSEFVYDAGLLLGKHFFDATDRWYTGANKNGWWFGFAEAARLELLDMNADATRKSTFPAYDKAVSAYRDAGHD